jgi:hypothetical protein
MYIGLHVKNLTLPDINETEFSQWIFEKYSNIEFYENPSGGSRVVSTWVDGQKDKTKLIVAFRNFTNALKNSLLLDHKNQLTVVMEFMAVQES